MSDGLGLDKPARRQAEADARAKPIPALEPPFPFTRLEFDPEFFGVADEPEQAAQPDGAV